MPHFAQQLHTPQNQQLMHFWEQQMESIEQISEFKNYELPLARIKKIMKCDEEVKGQMISAEAPVLFTKACELFILELTLRAWMHTEENKRKTLQKNDIAAALAQSDMYDFLIDIVPRDESKSPKKITDDQGLRQAPMVPPDLGQYYYQVAHQQVLQHQAAEQSQRTSLVDPYLLYQQQQQQHYSNPQSIRYYQHSPIMHQIQMPSDQQEHVQHVHDVHDMHQVHDSHHDIHQVQDIHQVHHEHDDVHDVHDVDHVPVHHSHDSSHDTALQSGDGSNSRQY